MEAYSMLNSVATHLSTVTKFMTLLVGHYKEGRHAHNLARMNKYLINNKHEM